MFKLNKTLRVQLAALAVLGLICSMLVTPKIAIADGHVETQSLCQENGGKYFSELKSLSGKTFIDTCADIFIEDWFYYLGLGLSTSTKRDLNLKKGKNIYLDLGVDKINSKDDSDYINGGTLEVYNWFEFYGTYAYEARVICSMNDEDADQYVANGMYKLKGAKLFGIFGGYSSDFGGGLIIKDCHIVGDDGNTF